MNVVTLDFESTYSTEYSLSKMTTEAYVRDSRFEAILCGFKVNDGPSFFIEGPRLKDYLPQLKLHECAVVMHHAHFDALILSHHYGIRPKLILDTLGMARALYGANERLSLAKLCEKEGIGAKGDEVEKVQGMRYVDFSYQALHRYGQYCKNDVDRTYDLAQIYLPQFSREELEINDYVIRMFTEPTLRLDVDLLTKYAAQLKIDKATLMLRAGANRDDLMSNPKFAQLLLELGIDPPMKISLKTNKLTYAFAKTDPGMQALAEHPDENVQALIAAHTGVKSTLAETRAERMIAMAANGAACLYLKYSGASGSHRLSGGDKMNWQNMTRGGVLRDALMAPEGQVIVVGDSSNIEARVLDKLAGQDDMVEVYRKADRKEGPDMYCTIAERIYKRPITKKDDPFERQMGKVCVAHDELVLTDQGLTPIQDITLQHRLWDGIEWVTHQGVVCNGEKEVIKYQGLWATPDHEVFCTDGRKIPLGQAASELARLVRSGTGGYPVRVSGDRLIDIEAGQRVHLRQGVLSQLGQDSMARIGQHAFGGGYVAASQWTRTRRARQDIGASIRRGSGALYKAIAQTVRGLWRTRHPNAVHFAHGVHPLGGETPPACELRRRGDRPQKQQWPLRARQSATCYAQGTVGQSTQYRLGILERWKGVGRRVAVALRARYHGALCALGLDGGTDYCAGAQSGQRETQELADYRRTPRVYDIVNAGPRHRFTVSGVLVANCKLGLGFGMGHEKFRATVRAQAKDTDGKPLVITPLFASEVVEIYRDAHPQVRKLWKRGDSALKAISQGLVDVAVDYQGIVRTCKDGIIMPGGLKILFPDLRFDKDGQCTTTLQYGEWTFWNGKAREHIYGAKFIENIVQCLARIIVFDQCRVTAKQLKGLAKWVHSVHDEGIFLADVFDAPYVLETLMNNMRKAPPWFPNLPLNSEGGFHQRYGQAKQ